MERGARFDTKAIHSGEPRPPILGSVNLPIFQSSTYLHDPEELAHGVRYHRLNNSPQHLSLGEKLAALEETEAALVTSSGMAAIATSLLALIGKGQHILVQERLYAGSRKFFDQYFPDYGRAVTFFDPAKLDELPKLVRPNTKGMYVEALENPLLRAYDFEQLVAFAKKHELLTFIDNTFPSPVNFQPAKLGFDVILHSATKYLNGHSDIIAGCVMGSKTAINTIREHLNVLGGCLDPQSCFLLQRGLKTLGLRVRQHNANAMALAEALTTMKTIKQVTYPGLPEHPDRVFIKKYFKGSGGMLTFEFGGSLEQLEQRLLRLKFAFNAPSLGGPETLITLPVQTSFANFSAQQLQELKLSNTLVRVSVGLEDPNDLIADFMQAFD